jgi:glutathionylspermidine synthase
MKRVACTPRPDWRQRLDARGFGFHSIDEHGVDRSAETDKFLYWREDVAYEFTEAQVEHLYEVSRELHAMSMDLAADLIGRGDLDCLRILPPAAQALVEASWAQRDPHLYGRFDISWNGIGEPKLLEYNADTPTSIIESAVAQWWWKEEVKPGADQFNSLHEALVERLRGIAAATGVTTLHLACLFDSQEDVGNLEYLLDVALQAGLAGSLVDMGAIAVAADGRFADGDDRPIEACFKLYPWEWMVREPLAPHLGARATRWLEPPWKMVLSNKAMLALLWERHTGHPNLLPAAFTPEPFGSRPHVRKPLLSREGANVSFIEGGQAMLETPGDYGADGFVYQGLAPVARYAAPEATSIHGPLDAIHAVLGTWIVGDEAVGLCVREDPGPVTKNTAYFVPHYFV